MRARSYTECSACWPRFDDAIQEAWLRLAPSDARQVDNLGGGWPRWSAVFAWTSSVYASSGARSRWRRGYPDPVVAREDGSDPEPQESMADSVGLALLVVLESLSPAE